jgi:hypothetical protein
LFEIIGYKDQESGGSRSRPDFQNESERFRVELRNADFLNPSRSNPIFGSLDGSCRLSEAMKSFSVTAQAYHINYIKEKLISKNPPGITHPIPVTAEEEEKQSEESSMTNRELILVIESLIGTLNEINLPQFKGLKSKKKDELLLILQQVKELHNSEVEVDV